MLGWFGQLICASIQRGWHLSLRLVPLAGRLTNKQRKRTLTEEIMADDHLTQVGGEVSGESAPYRSSRLGDVQGCQVAALAVRSQGMGGWQ